MKLSTKLAACLLCAVVAIPSGVAFADVGGEDVGGAPGPEEPSITPYKNSTDEKFYFTFKKHGATSNGARARKKDDSSSVYVQVLVKKCDRCRAFVDRNTDGRWVNSVTGKAKRATITKLGQFSILVTSSTKNKMVRLTGWADSTAGDVSGYWSPDSTRNYTVINDA